MIYRFTYLKNEHIIASVRQNTFIVYLLAFGLLFFTAIQGVKAQNTVGFLITPMTQAEFQSLSNPSNGMLVLITDMNQLCTYVDGLWHCTTAVELPRVAAVSVVSGSDYAMVSSLLEFSGGAYVTQRGFCWGLSPNPDIGGSHLAQGGGPGPFSTVISGLNPGNTYYIRAYAINSGGVSYGEQTSFSTSPPASVAGNNGPVCEGGTLRLTAAEVPGATYLWTGPNGFSSSEQNPMVSASATLSMAGEYSVVARIGESSSPAATTTVVIVAAPALATAQHGTRCGTGSVNIGVSNVPSGSTIDWYAASSGGNVLSGGSGTASFSTPSISTTTTYYAQTRNTSTGCVSNSRIAVTATIVSTPASPTAGTHDLITDSQIRWQWNSVSGATGYRWHTTNNFNTATEKGTTRNHTETGLAAGTSYTRYVWAYRTEAGLTCTSGARSISATTQSGYKVGDIAGGGVVFYVSGSTILVAAASDQSTSTQWHHSTGDHGGGLSAIGGGYSNTYNGVETIARKICKDLTLGGHNDWFLPSRTELGELMQNSSIIGGFPASTYYWSSTHWTFTEAYYGRTGSSASYTNDKRTEGYRVRCIRAL